MKQRLVAVLTYIVLLFVAVHVANSCEVEVKVVGEQKPVYKEGEIVILEVTVFLTHHNCPEGIKSTEFKAEGMKLLGAKEWKQLTSERFSRLIKAEIVGGKDGEAVVYVRRSCDKEGGYGVLKLKVQ